MKVRSFALLFAFFVAFQGDLKALTAADYQAWHEQCLAAKNTKPIDEIIVRFQAVVDADPKDHVAKVYLGSAYTLRSAESGWGPKKLEYLKKGCRIMDEAVAAAPADPMVRLVRGVNSYRLPKRFKRRPLAVEDFTVIVPIAEVGTKGLSDSDRQVIFYYAWRTFKDDGKKEEAEKARKACHEIAPDSWFGNEARS